MSARLPYLAVEAAEAGRAVEQTRVRHTHLTDYPIGIVLFHPAAEPFAPAAIAYGTGPDDRHEMLCRDPRNRQLLFDALMPFADWFNTVFELPGDTRIEDEHGRELAAGIPQVVVANPGTWTALGMLGRRLAYLGDIDGQPPPQQLVTLGQHLQFLIRRDTDGQQVTVPLTALLNDHWATPLSDEESLSLPALDAWVDPPTGQTGWEAAWAAEVLPMGPLAAATSDAQLDRLLGERRDAQDGSRKAKEADRDIARLLSGWLDAPWHLLWRCVEREREQPEAAHVQRRVQSDIGAYTAHLDWQIRAGGLRRTRHTVKQAAGARNEYERDTQQLEYERAIDDPLCLIPHLLDGKGFTGTVVDSDEDHHRIPSGGKRMSHRPLLVIDADREIFLSTESKLTWPAGPSQPWVVDKISNGGTRVMLYRDKGTAPPPGERLAPVVGERVAFTTLTPPSSYRVQLADDPPWTHVPVTAVEPASLEEVA